MTINKMRGFMAVFLVLILLFLMTACGGTSNPDGKNGTGTSSQNGSGSEEEQMTAEITAGTITYSHGCILKSYKYPYWEAMSKDLKSGELKPMVLFDDRVYIDGDDTMEAFFGDDSQSFSSATHDLMYIYTMPYDATVDIEITTRVSSEMSNGIVAYCYINDTSNYLIENRTVTLIDDVIVIGAYSTELKKGDKIYCGYNSNGSTAEDGGNYYVKMTYLSVNK